MTISHSYEQNFPMLPIILFPTIYNLAVCSLDTLNPSEQFSICSTITESEDLVPISGILEFVVSDRESSCFYPVVVLFFFFNVIAHLLEGLL